MEQEGLLEWMDQEEFYLAALVLLHSEFVEPLNKEVLLLVDSERLPKTLFLQVEQMIEIHRKLQEHFLAVVRGSEDDGDDCKARSRIVHELAACLLVFSTEPFQVSYGKFAIDYDEWISISTLPELLSSTVFQDFTSRVKERVQTDSRLLMDSFHVEDTKGPSKARCPGALGCKVLSLRSLLTFPIQRLQKYEKMIAWLKRQVSLLPAHEQEEIERDLKEVENGLIWANRKVHWHALSDALDREVLEKIQQRFDTQKSKASIPKLLSPDRYLVRDGVLLVEETEKKFGKVRALVKRHLSSGSDSESFAGTGHGAGTILRVRRVLLFNDMILWVGLKSLTPKGAFILQKGTISRPDLESSLSDGSESLGLAVITPEGQVLRLIADSKSSFDVWLHDIGSCVRQLFDASAHQQKKYEKRILSLAPRASLITMSRSKTSYASVRDILTAEREKFKKRVHSLPRQSSSSRTDNFSVSIPYNVSHAMKISIDLEWGPKIIRSLSIKEKIGEGSFGHVYRALFASGAEMAVKLISTSDIKEENLNEIRKEIDILKQVSHPNIVSYFGCFGPDDNGKLWVLMDYCDCGSMAKVLAKPDVELDEVQLAYILSCCIDALTYLHAKGIYHLDVKAANILVTKSGAVKLCDFGVSSQTKTGEDHTEEPSYSSTVSQGDDLMIPVARSDIIGSFLVGTPYFMAPEIIKGIPPSDKSDVWSLGITAIELADGMLPHAHQSPFRVLRTIVKSPPPKLRDESYWSADFVDFVSACLVKDPAERPTMASLQSHSFIRKHRSLKSCLILKEFLEKTNSSNKLKTQKSSSHLFSISDEDVKKPKTRSHRASFVHQGSMLISDNVKDSDSDSNPSNSGTMIVKADKSTMIIKFDGGKDEDIDEKESDSKSTVHVKHEKETRELLEKIKLM